MKAFLIAGTASGEGKTTVSLALCAAFRERGLRVQAFKCGPDFLDTGHLSAISGRAARNLDSWMLDEQSNRDIFARGASEADIAVVEGMMGLFDGVSGGGEKGSAAEIAKLLSLPVILVLDASKSARSLAAVIHGFETFDPQLRFAGLVLNRVAGESHYRLIRDAIRTTSRTPLLGWLPRDEVVAIPERHLGLRTADEESSPAEKRRSFAAFAEKHLDLDRLLNGEDAAAQRAHATTRKETSISLGVARDAAFCFYYQDNLDLLEAAGAKIVAFSPLTDSDLPPGLDALYLGGGYPELYAEQLSSNHRFLSSLRSFAQSGRPIYAECGGMMYLGEELCTREGHIFSMASVLPLRIEMTDRLVRFGYVEVEFTHDCFLAGQGTVARTHSFHYSRAIPTGNLTTPLRARYSLSGLNDSEGCLLGNVLGSYFHLHFAGDSSIAVAFVQASEAIKHSLAESPSTSSMQNVSSQLHDRP
jgi:cobyrinic acid a,c-diamide synthase